MSELPQLAEPAKQTAHQKEAPEIATPKVANKTKMAEEQQPAMKTLKQKVKQRQSKNKQAKR